MKLAEALIIRADLQKRIEELRGRLTMNATVQEGEKPAEEPAKLLTELDALIKQLCELMAKINLTNSQTMVDGMTLTELIAMRDCLTKKVDIMREFLSCASMKYSRSRVSEIVIKSTVPVSELQKNVDILAKELREIDTKIQATNWTTDLIN